ncbi:hypothetical protein Acsp03_31090 [Actinomadura sp. NBRC 104412]|uniref:DUF305 domain-containing protein n=1 Tax=Actinomadura sp. NBRC 104412 TaxID=3032203 RepID=UPI0024A44049|nr:DUF305 domain-containing protein [Actinomadura sp. NBRC 104412]GLZ05643.1 hypothetical protein Acsp03_31090 [Actinomadura sp. NBRC 104412]
MTRLPHRPSRASFRRGTGLAVAAALALSGCAAEPPAEGDPGGRTAAFAQPRSAPAPPTATASVAPPNSQDVTFAAMMIVHHGQAVWMSRTLLGKRDVPERAAAVAGFIRTDQQREIDEMNRWLAAWRKPVVRQDDPRAAKLHGDGHGMLGKARLSALESATDGRHATRLYLRGMIEHHRGAITMARAVLRVGRNVYIRNLAKHIINEQSAEIEAMTRLLEDPA